VPQASGRGAAAEASQAAVLIIADIGNSTSGIV
jgi:hypothetical protein